MGRFDALTHLEEPNKTPTHPPVTSAHAVNQSPSQSNSQAVAHGKKPEIKKTRKPEHHFPTQNLLIKPEKYSTLLPPDLIKKVKLFAAQRDLKDYEVLERALTEYFQKHPEITIS